VAGVALFRNPPTAPRKSLVLYIRGDLFPNLPSGPRHRVDVDVCSPRPHRFDQLAYLARLEPLTSRRSSRGNIGADLVCVDRSGNDGWCSRTGLDSDGAISEVCTKKDRDAAVDSGLAKVNVGLLNRSLEIGI
jgi:hypothetical protein